MDTKRLLLAVILSVGLLFVWTRYFAPQEGEPSKSARKYRRKKGRGPKAGRGRRGKGSGPGGTRKVRKVSAVKLGPEVVTRVEGRLYRAEFSSYGGVLKSFVLLDPQYRERVTGSKTVRQVNLVRAVMAENLPLKVQFPQSGIMLAEPQQWELVVDKKGVWSSGQVHPDADGSWHFGYRWRDAAGRVEIIKAFTLRPNESYAGDMVVELRNLGEERLKERLRVVVASMDFGEKGRSIFRPVSLRRKAVCRVNGDVKERSYGLITGTESRSGCGAGCSSCSCQRTPAKTNVFAGKISWGGIDEKYFLLAVAPVGFKDAAQCRFSGRKTKRGGLIRTELNFPEVVIPPKGRFVHRFVIFGGPKQVSALAAADPVDAKSKSQVSLHFVDSVDFGILGFLGKPMVWLMRWFYGFLGNWGLSIILVTILIKLATIYWTTKSMRSMKEMQRLKPQMDALKEKYGDDKVRYQQEVAALMKRHKVNPLGGCLPMLLQMPIYIAWYQALMASVELYRAPLFGWIDDLTAPDPYFVLPLIMGAAMFVQQRMTPAAADNPQAKMMSYMMPIMFTGFMLFLPSGLTLYILVNVILSMIHQWYLNHAS